MQTLGAALLPTRLCITPRSEQNGKIQTSQTQHKCRVYRLAVYSDGVHNASYESDESGPGALSLLTPDHRHDKHRQ
jgi:hypothetical protein